MEQSETGARRLTAMNAVTRWTYKVGRGTRRRFGGARALERRFALDLAGFLNRLRRAELDELAEALEVATDGSIGQLRARLWLVGATIEAGGSALIGSRVQPAPVVLGERLQFQAPARGRMPASPSWPRPMPPPVTSPDVDGEPATLDELLARADALVGVRLGTRGRDKGQYGAEVAARLGVVEHGRSEPDWRGEVELKTLPVIRDASGLWRIKEDPAISMEQASPRTKLARVLWILRVADDPSSPILSWYYQERDEALAAIIDRDLHTRPKGPRGTLNKGWYLRKRFFLASGLLASLNG